jgi:hypothetical protein
MSVYPYTATGPSNSATCAANGSAVTSTAVSAPGASVYECIVFCQGDDADEPLDLLYNRHDTVSYHGPTAESIDAAFSYLAQWDYGDPAEQCADPASGAQDDVWEQGGYRLTAHLGLGYVGLERVITLPVELYRCPCCGTDVMDSRPVCGDCRAAGCEETCDSCGELGYWECERPDAYSCVIERARFTGNPVCVQCGPCCDCLVCADGAE